MKPQPDKQASTVQRVAMCYFRLFSTPDGKKVLADLKAKFGEERPRFKRGGSTSIQDAGIIDGECNVLREIRQAIEAGKNAKEDSP